MSSHRSHQKKVFLLRQRSQVDTEGAVGSGLELVFVEQPWLASALPQLSPWGWGHGWPNVHHKCPSLPVLSRSWEGLRFGSDSS